MDAPFDDERTAGPAGLTADVLIADDRWRAIDPFGVVDVTLSGLAASPHAPRHRIALEFLFTDDATLADLNGRFRHKPVPTNVLAFPSEADPACDAGGDEGAGAPDVCPGAPAFVGSVAIAYGVCEREADARGLGLTDHAAHLVLHGLLHLLGFDHETEPDRREMEWAEQMILDGLGIADPYGDDDFPAAPHARP